MRKIVAMFTAIVFALTIVIAFTPNPALAEKRSEEGVRKKKEEKKAKKTKKTKKETEKDEQKAVDPAAK